MVLKALLSITRMDWARWIFKNVALLMALLIFVCVVVGILAKLYEISGLKDWKRRRFSSETDDTTQLDGGSARRLLVVGSDGSDAEGDDGTAADGSENAANGSPAAAGGDSAPSKRTLAKGKDYPTLLRRQHSNSDSESTISGAYTQVAQPSSTRARSEMKKLEEQQRRARTLSESGVVVTRAMSAQDLNSEASSYMPVPRQMSHPHRTTRTALAELQKSISESSSQQDSIPSDPNLPTMSVSVARAAAQEEAISEDVDASPRSNGTSTVGGGTLAASATSSPASTRGRLKPESVESSKRPKGHWIRSLLLGIVLAMSLGGFTLLACSERWIESDVCVQGMKTLLDVMKGLEGIKSLWEDGQATCADTGGEVEQAGWLNNATPPLSVTAVLTDLTIASIMRRVATTWKLLSPVAVGVFFVSVASCLVICRRPRSGSPSSSSATPSATTATSSNKVSGVTSGQAAAGAGQDKPKRRLVPPAPIRVSPSSHDGSAFFPETLTSPHSTVSRRSNAAPQAPDYISSLMTKLEKVGGFSCVRGDPRGVELPNVALTQNLIQQSAVFCLLITDDPFGRPRCIDEVRIAIQTKATALTVIITLDKALDMPLNDELEKLIGQAPVESVVYLTWPAEMLAKRNSSLGVFEDERRPTVMLSDWIRKAKAKRRFALWDIFFSHFQRSLHHQLYPSLPSARHSPSLAHAQFSSSSQLGSGLVPAFGSIVSKVSDAKSIAATVTLLEAMIAAKSIGEAEGHALLAVLHSKEQEATIRVPEMIYEPHSSNQSVVEVPLSPASYFRDTRTDFSDGDDDVTSDEMGATRSVMSEKGPNLHQYRNMTTEIARKTTQQQQQQSMREQNLDESD